MSERRILIVEDEAMVRNMVTEVLEEAGFEVFGASDAASGMALLDEVEPDLLLLDLNLPGRMNGAEMCRRLRVDPSRATVAIVVLTGVATPGAEQQMLDAGADDYVRKEGFKPNLLVSRVRAVLRRTRREESAGPIRTDHLVMDPAERRTWAGGREIPLTPTEFAVLYKLASNPGRILKRSDLLDRGDGASSAVERTVDVHVMSIRRKLGTADWLIATVWNAGYRLGSPPRPDEG